MELFLETFKRFCYIGYIQYWKFFPIHGNLSLFTTKKSNNLKLRKAKNKKNGFFVFCGKSIAGQSPCSFIWPLIFFQPITDHYRVPHGKVDVLNWLCRVEICKSDFVWRFFGNLEIFRHYNQFLLNRPQVNHPRFHLVFAQFLSGFY